MSLVRLKIRIDNNVNDILNQLPQDLIINGTVMDPIMGGGQFVKEIERRKRAAGKTDDEIAATVFGIEENIIRRNYAVNNWKLKGTYVVGNALKMNFDNKTFDIVIGNTPFSFRETHPISGKKTKITDDRHSKKYLTKAVDLCTSNVAMMMSFNHRTCSPTMMEKYRSQGLYKIEKIRIRDSNTNVDEYTGVYYFNRSKIAATVLVDE